MLRNLKCDKHTGFESFKKVFIHNAHTFVNVDCVFGKSKFEHCYKIKSLHIFSVKVITESYLRKNILSHYEYISDDKLEIYMLRLIYIRRRRGSQVASLLLCCKKEKQRFCSLNGRKEKQKLDNDIREIKRLKRKRAYSV